jgi:GT2 family glycosyltransferase
MESPSEANTDHDPVIVDAADDPASDEVVSGDPGALVTTAEDSVNCYRFWLGRNPESAEAVEGNVGRPLVGVIDRMLGSDEFGDILSALLKRELLPHRLFSTFVPRFLLDWAIDRLPLHPASITRLQGSWRWSHILSVVLMDDAFRSAVGVIADVSLPSSLLDYAMPATPGTAGIEKPREMDGAIEFDGGLELRGWCANLLDKQERPLLEIYINTQFAGTVTCGDFRRDVQERIGGHGRYGFSFPLPPAYRDMYESGAIINVLDATSKSRVGLQLFIKLEYPERHSDIIKLIDEVTRLRASLERVEAQLPRALAATTVPLDLYDSYWHLYYNNSIHMSARQRSQPSRTFAYRPLISVVMRTHNSDLPLLNRAFTSMAAQSYDNWQLIVCDDASTLGDELTHFLETTARNDGRVTALLSNERQGWASTYNAGLTVATGEYICFLDQHAELSPDALECLVSSLQNRRFALVYSDEDRVSVDGAGRESYDRPILKTDFDYDLLLSESYIGNFLAIQADILNQAGGVADSYEGARRHDLLLRVVERITAQDIHHISRVLYHSSRSVEEMALNSEERRQESTITCVQHHLARAGIEAAVERQADPLGGERLFANRILWPLPEPAPSVCIIIPTRDRTDLLGPCLSSVLSFRHLYPGPVEILVIDNDSTCEQTAAYLESVSAVDLVRVLTFKGRFNWAAINNFAARNSLADILIFLNNDVVVLTKDWCRELVSHANRPDVGAVGARLLYQDGTIQHAGVLLGVNGTAGHEGIGERTIQGGYGGRTHMTHTVSAITGACLATRRSIFEEVKGFDEVNLRVAFNDIDYCMKLGEKGYRLIYTPYATLYHFESKSRGLDTTEAQLKRHDAEMAVFQTRWQHRLSHDPFYNAHFDRYARPFTRLRAPVA